MQAVIGGSRTFGHCSRKNSLLMYINSVREYGSLMHQVNITELRKHLPNYLKQVSLGEEIQITSHGKVIARLIPERDEAEAARQRLFALRGKGFVGDVVSPIENVQWTADDDNL